MATKTALGGAIAGIGRALMRREDIAREDALLARQDQRQNELMDREDARQNELLARQEQRDDLVAARQAAIERAREIRQDMMRQAEREDDRAFQRELLDTQFNNQRALAGEESGMLRERWQREDRRAIEEQATEQLAALDKRITDLQDMQLKGEALGGEGEIARQIKEAEDQKLAIRGRLVDRLYEMGDPRYKDMPADQRLYAAGYSKDQVARFMRLAEGQASEEPPAESPAGASDTEIAARTRSTDPARVAQYGLSDQDRTALGLPPQGEPAMPAEPAMQAPDSPMQPPESPPPLRDMTQAGRGRKAFGFGSREQLSSDTPLARLADALTPDNRPSLRADTPLGRLLMPGAAPKDAKPPSAEAVAAKSVLEALRSGEAGKVRSMPELKLVLRMSPSQLRKVGYTEDEIKRAKRLPPHRSGTTGGGF